MFFGQRRLSQPSRFLAEIPGAAVEATGARPAPRERPPRPPVIAPSGRAAKTAELRPGTRVRHPLFGVGTVVQSDGSGEDLKLTVSFAGVGAKRLVARYAGLER